MRTIFPTLAALAAIAVATPAAAQPWGDHGESDHGTRSGELQMQIDAGVRSGSISRSELPPLRHGLFELVRLERQYGPGGISGREHATLQQRSAALRQQIDRAEQTRTRRYGAIGRGDREGRMAWEASYDRDHRAAWNERYDRERLAAWNARFGADDLISGERFDRPNRGDRFNGDVRIGQRYSARMVALPAEYRIEYPDTDRFYHGFDNGRIYRVDRSTSLILGMLDLSN
ncbi:MAG TPA: hypothetical protein VEA61_05580 [Allosphingosinicella sp.]|nr:hypothetical protein [Allosphingosinicella sp.]